MKRCRNCVYHADDGRCNKLDEVFRDETRWNEDVFGIDISMLNDDSDWVSAINLSDRGDSDKPIYRIETPDWFGCIFHLKIIKEK